MKGAKHYKKDGTVQTHGKTSIKLVHYKDLGKVAKAKADGAKTKPKKS